jgi:hypothetical protein
LHRSEMNKTPPTREWFCITATLAANWVTRQLNHLVRHRGPLKRPSMAGFGLLKRK